MQYTNFQEEGGPCHFAARLHPSVFEALQKRAREQGKSVNALLNEVIPIGLDHQLKNENKET